MKQYNFNANFSNFRKNIDLTDDDKKDLLSARKEIRAAIRKAFNENQTEYFTQDTIQLLSEFTTNIDKKIKPLFMSQGSFVYKTINLPSNPPTQQMDLDDGVYLPLSYIENESNGNFQAAANIVREVIQKCVQDLCDKKNWSLKKHSKCLRITITSKAHIDLPIYSIPDKEAHTIKESYALNFSDPTQFSDSASRFLSYDEATNILLATDDGWLRSDPREIQEWVEEMKDEHGTKFIFYSRYIKAWRDHQYPQDNSKFSSIMIMAAIAQAFSEEGYTKNENVALDLSAVVNSIGIYLNQDGVKHPCEDTKLDEHLPGRTNLTNFLTSLSIGLSEAVRTDNETLLVTSFGSRFPEGTGIESNITAALIASRAYSTPLKPAIKY
ncbi:MAG: hypothetical protein HFP76_00640 [Methylococcales symbiont of Iophon sp. n. MRB-2018]|nr:MAG: hypothetical protein HFP76_00640 [Methylococcales symbiont of Iophon sp. n. MRB-2018]